MRWVGLLLLLGSAALAGTPFLGLEWSAHESENRNWRTLDASLQLISSQLVNVKSYGAKGDGITDDTNAIAAAMAACPSSGCTVQFPAGTFVVSSKACPGACSAQTAGICICDQRIDLMGAGSPGQEGSPAAVPGGLPITRIKSATNTAVVRYASVAGTALGLGSQMTNLGLAGSGAGSSQIGLVVDNRGIVVNNVSIWNMGSDGVQILNSIQSLFTNLRVFDCIGDGIKLNEVGSKAVTFNTFYGLQLIANGGAGINAVAGGWGTTVHGALLQSNVGKGILLTGTAGKPVDFCFMEGLWDEGNGGSITFGANAIANNVSYVRYSSGVPSYVALANRNTVSGVDLADPTQSRLGLAEKLQAFNTTGSLRVRSYLDDEDVDFQARQYRASLGFSVSASLSDTRIAGTGAFNTANNQCALASRNAANSADICLAKLTSANAVAIPSPSITTGVIQGSGLKHQRFLGITVNAASDLSYTATWTSAFADSLYTPSCVVYDTQAPDPSGVTLLRLESITASAVVARLRNADGANPHTVVLECIAMHD